jgi:hypothetical protein
MLAAIIGAVVGGAAATVGSRHRTAGRLPAVIFGWIIGVVVATVSGMLAIALAHFLLDSFDSLFLPASVYSAISGGAAAYAVAKASNAVRDGHGGGTFYFLLAGGVVVIAWCIGSLVCIILEKDWEFWLQWSVQCWILISVYAALYMYMKKDKRAYVVLIIGVMLAGVSGIALVVLDMKMLALLSRPWF